MQTNHLLSEDSVILVSGGARGITASCVVKLAEKAHCRFILLGRSSAQMPALDFDAEDCSDTELKRRIAASISASGEKPVPAKIQKIFSSIRSSQEIQTTLRAVDQSGGHAEYICVDVADPALPGRLQDPVSRLGTVTGIIHGAGTLVDKLIEKKTTADFETVYTPKITGLENMLRSVDANQLDFLVLFSSIVGFYGNVGQSDYAIANEILNKSAYQLKQKLPGCQVISINWGPWDSGMVTPELKKVFEARNVEVIPTDVGARILVDALTNGANLGDRDRVQIIVGGAPVRPAVHVAPELRTYEVHRRLTVRDNPFLKDHTIGGNPVLPATCAASWIIFTCEQIYPGFRCATADRFRVLKGIVFDDSLADEYVLELKEVEKSSEKIQFEAMILSTNKSNGRKIFHYSLQASLVREMPEPPLLPFETNFLEEPISGSKLYGDGTMFHGPAFQGVKQILQLSKDRIVMDVNLPALDDRVQGQFPACSANPFLYDAVVQSVLIWSQTYYQAPGLPSSLRRLEQYRPIFFGKPYRVTMVVESHTSASVVVTIDVQDDQGYLCMRLVGLEGTISPYLNRFIGRRE
jgi:NAD(P)-dependent dehydrogenase (short-subunit alcohol dehydrogenase family)